jgi:phosphatidylglycerophosphate synthase
MAKKSFKYQSVILKGSQMAILAMNPKAWITLGPILFINLALLISLLAYTFTKKKRKRDIPESATRHRSKFLATHFKEWWVFSTDPIARLFVRLGIRPSILTFIGFLFSAAAAVFFAKGLFGYAGWIMIAGATFDIFDGRVARLTNQETRSGAFYDSVMDRFGEGVCFLGLAYYFRAGWVLFFVIAGLIGSMLVSYTKARGLTFGVDCKGGTMQRPERIVYLGVASVLDPVASIILSNWFITPPPVLVIGALIIIGIMTNFTAAHRMIFIMNSLDTADKSGRETIPQLITKLATTEGREAIFAKARYGYDRSRISFAHILMFLVDGASASLFAELMQKGDLPNISRYIAERGSKTDAVSTFPSTTGPAFTPFLTGCFPGTCNVPGAKWFDRSVPQTKVLTMNRFRDYMGWGAYAMDYDLSKSVRTIFEYSRRAVNIFGMVNRGCGIMRDATFFRLHSLYRKQKKSLLNEMEDEAFQWLTQALHRKADYIFYAFPSVDLAASGQHKDHEEKQDALRRFDKIIGKTVNLLNESGMFDETAIFIGSDHSHGVCEHSFDLTRFLSSRFSTLKYPKKLREWNETTAIPLLSGNAMAHLYLRKDSGWEKRYFFEEIEQTGLVGSLLEKPEVDLLMGRSAEGGIIILSRAGRAHVVEDADGRIAYIVKGADPMGLEGIPPALDSARAFLLTAESQRPDGIVQSLQLFRSPRSGDLILSAGSGCTLEECKPGAATHGSLLREHSMVPFFSTVPVTAKTIRTADIMALVLDIFGIEAEHRLDGTSPAYKSPDSLAALTDRQKVM